MLEQFAGVADTQALQVGLRAHAGGLAEPAIEGAGGDIEPARQFGHVDRLPQVVLQPLLGFDNGFIMVGTVRLALVGRRPEAAAYFRRELVFDCPGDTAAEPSSAMCTIRSAIELTLPTQ